MSARSAADAPPAKRVKREVGVKVEAAEAAEAADELALPVEPEDAAWEEEAAWEELEEAFVETIFDDAEDDEGQPLSPHKTEQPPSAAEAAKGGKGGKAWWGGKGDKDWWGGKGGKGCKGGKGGCKGGGKGGGKFGGKGGMPAWMQESFVEFMNFMKGKGKDIWTYVHHHPPLPSLASSFSGCRLAVATLTVSRVFAISGLGSQDCRVAIRHRLLPPQ